MKTKTIKNLNAVITNGRESEKHWEGNVTISWKTKQVLIDILDNSTNVTSNFLIGDEIDFAKFEMMDEFRFSAEVDVSRNENGGWRASEFIASETSMNKANGWDGREITKLKKLGIIDWISTGDGDWGCARIWFVENCQDKILLFKDIDSKSQLDDQKDNLTSELVKAFHNTADAINKLGVVVKKDNWNDVEDVIVAELRDAISKSANDRREKNRFKRATARKVRELKKQIAKLEK